MNSTIPPVVPRGGFVVLEGVVSGLQRTTHVSGGSGDSSARTTHICLFSIGAHRAELKLSEVAPIADGDTVRLAGTVQPGLFSAIACRNLTTGWMSSPGNQGCTIAFAICFFCFGLLFAGVAFSMAGGIAFVGSGGVGLFAIMPFLIGIAGLAGTSWAAYAMLNAAGKTRRAHEMIA